MTTSSDKLSWRQRRQLRRRELKKEPAYILTSSYDGTKYIDPNAFLRDKDIKEQLDWFQRRDATTNPHQQG